MKKFAISLIALAALSTASLAEGRRDDDLRQSGILNSGYGTQLNGTSTGVNAFAVEKTVGALTAYELASQKAVENTRDFNHQSN